MAVDKNLFLYDVALVAIMKNEGHYIKEWLDYHLLAGVDHFYIYDNESPDNQKEILKPYIDAGIVTYNFSPGINLQNYLYNKAVQNFKFFCRYMTFIDGDEFILPRSNKSISEVTDEIFSRNPNISGLHIHWHCFGSNGQEKADYTKGVLERFTRRASNDNGVNSGTKIITNPRKISWVFNPHLANYFEGTFAIRENGDDHLIDGQRPYVSEKIAINHYIVKSKEEFIDRKVRQFRVASTDTPQIRMDQFKHLDVNEEFDDEILKYRDTRLNALNRDGGGLAVLLERQKNKLRASIKCVSPKSFADDKFKFAAAIFYGKNGNVFNLPRSHTTFF